jgi:hypothetical protein
MSLEALAKKGPDTSFIHDFPEPVKSSKARGTKGVAKLILKAGFQQHKALIYIPNQECGKRQLFLSTSARDLADTGGDIAKEPLTGGVPVARGTSRKARSGMCTLSAGTERAQDLRWSSF